MYIVMKASECNVNYDVIVHGLNWAVLTPYVNDTRETMCLCYSRSDADQMACALNSTYGYEKEL